MWEKLIDAINKIFTLTSRTDRLEKDIESLNQEIKRLSILVNEHSSKIDVLVYAVQAESDKTKMWVEKELARFERRLPAGKEKDDEKD
jgi:prefoldin subunit 5